ncbi:MAG: biopolymer transporter ExbD [Verrucomicrobiales bacterium]|nr:biopolymer transporter ExbD [Verrucomicrobiales bacterium]
MNHRKPLPRPDSEPQLDMSSMIDVSFLLLIFFLVTSSLDPKETDLGMVLPTDKEIPGLDCFVEPMEIKIASNGSITVDLTLLDTDLDQRQLPLLEDKLRIYKDSSDLLSTEPMITVISSDEASGQRFIDVLNTLAKVDIKDVTIADISAD